MALIHVVFLFDFLRYEVRIEARSFLGCASSGWPTVKTSGAAPVNQPAPRVELQIDSDGFSSIFVIYWTMRQQPNGKILSFEGHRRQILSNPSTLDATLVYKNTSTSLRDSFTECECQQFKEELLTAGLLLISRKVSGLKIECKYLKEGFAVIHLRRTIITFGYWASTDMAVQPKITQEVLQWALDSPPALTLLRRQEKTPKKNTSRENGTNLRKGKDPLPGVVHEFCRDVAKYLALDPNWSSTPPKAPQYRAPFSVISNLTTIYLDWSHSFVLNGELKEYILTENAVWLYSGLRSSLHLPRTSDKSERAKRRVACPIV
ncbi:USH2A protein, partial [Polypterus senegalus]